MFDQNFKVLNFSHKRPPPIPQILKHYSIISWKAKKITAMDKGKNIQMEITREELQRKIEHITQEIQ